MRESAYHMESSGMGLEIPSFILQANGDHEGRLHKAKHLQRSPEKSAKWKRQSHTCVFIASGTT